MFLRIITGLLLLVYSLSGFTQKFINLKTYNVDSLQLLLPDQQGEERINSLNYLAVSLSFINYNHSKQYAEEAMNLSREINYKKGIAAAYRNFGQIYVYQGQYPKALNNYFDALLLYEKLNLKRTAGWVCHEISKTHYLANNFEKAFEYGNKALAIFKERTPEGTVGTARDSINILGGASELYWKMGMLEESLEAGLRALDLMKKNNFSNIELMINTWVVGVGFTDMGPPDSAIYYFHKALNYPDESLHMKTLKYRNRISLGWLYYATKMQDSAMYYLQTAYEFYEKHGILYWALNTSRGLGYICLANSDLHEAEMYLTESERIFDEMKMKKSWFRYDSIKNIANYGFELYFPLPPIRLKEMMWNEGRILYKLLYRLKTIKNETEQALKYHIAYSNAKDTLNKIRRECETVELQTRFESKGKDQRIATLLLENKLKESQLYQNRLLLLSSFGLLLIVLLFGYLLFRQNKLKTDQQMLVLQQKFFRSQMNPHFIFNSMASIQNFVVNQDSKKASIYLSRFSELVRSILDNSVQEYIPFEKEVNTIENYLELQKVRFPDKFDYYVNVDDNIDPENMLIPPMLAQPFIENSIEHGFKHKEAQGKLEIRFTLKGNLIVFEIQDDGVGRDKAQEIEYKLHKDHRSMATDITRERLLVLNKKLKQKISLIISDLKDEKDKPAGTKVVLDIPIKFI